MKKLFIVAAVAVFGLTACKKDFDCKCTAGGTTTTTTFPDVKKADAEEACDALSAISAIGGGSCELE